MDAIAAGFGPDINHRVTGAGGGGTEDTVTVGQTNSHRIHQNITIIGFVEINLATDCRDANAISISANAGDNTAEQMPGLFMVCRAKTQSVEQGNRARAHCEHIAQNTTDTGRRPLIRLNK